VFKEMPSLTPPKVVWVGRLAVGKRLEWLLDIAQRMPGVEFHVAGANMKEDSYSRGLYARFSRSANVVWLGQVPLDRIGEVYRGSLCLCCTSLHEGFPNTFLEAWSYGRPVVSSWDPDGLIVRNEMGLVSKSVDEFTQAISRLLAEQDLWRKCSSNGRRYYEKNHLTDVAMGRFVRVFMDLSSKNAVSAQMTVQ